MKETTTINRRARFLCGSAIVAAGLSLASVAAAQTAQPVIDQSALAAVPAGEATVAPEQDIVVTGSRIRRAEFTASTPVSVLSQEDAKLAGTVNVEKLLSDSPQFVGSQNGGATSNTVPGGTADVNLRGFGATRNLVLVNGRRFAIYGPDQVTDLNTIPSSLIARTEIVTGGSSAVYGSDAITGVVNFIMRDDFEGVEAKAQVNLAAPTSTPTYNFDLTLGGNFADGRGNLVVSGNYLRRKASPRGERGDFAYDSLSDGCVVPGTGSANSAGTPFAIPAGQTCTSGRRAARLHRRRQRRHPEWSLLGPADLRQREPGAAGSLYRGRSWRARLAWFHLQRCRHRRAPGADAAGRFQPRPRQLPDHSAGTLDDQQLRPL